MNGLANALSAGSATLRVAFLATMLIFIVGTSQAAPDGGRSPGRDGRTHSGGGYRSHNVGGGRSSGGGGRTTMHGWGRTSGVGGRTHILGGGRTYGSGSYDGGARHYDGGGRYDEPYGYRHIQPRTIVSFGIGSGLPYDGRRAYRSDVGPAPVEVESGTPIDVTNEPPAGCYYYDRFCDRQFSNLDEYTDHVEGQDHPRTIEIVQRDSGDWLRSLEFVDGSWSVMK